jgi:hypothetical protein
MEGILFHSRHLFHRLSRLQQDRKFSSSRPEIFCVRESACFKVKNKEDSKIGRSQIERMARNAQIKKFTKRQCEEKN